MKKVMYSFAVKFCAVLLSFVTAAAAVVGVIAAILMYSEDFYTRSEQTVENRIIGGMLSSEAHRMINQYYDFDNKSMSDSFADEYAESNLYYTIVDDSGRVIADNYNDRTASVLLTSTESVARSVYYSEFYGEDYYDYYDDYPGGDYALVSRTELTVTVYLRSDFTVTDRYTIMYSLIRTGYGMRYYIFILIFLCAVITLLCWVHLIRTAGLQSADGPVRFNPLDRIPFDVYAVIVIVLLLFFGALLVDAFYGDLFMVLILCLFCSVAYFAVMGLILSLSTRLKARNLLKQTLSYRFLHWVYKLLSRPVGRLRYLFNNLNLVWKVALAAAGVAILELLAILAFGYAPEALVLVWLIGNFMLIPTIILVAIMLVKLNEGGKRIAEGNLDYHIDTTYMYGDFKRFGENLNHINVGLQTAVNERMRSERMKTELITNVSHDIKTPLTSIINYVDLIKKENPENETVREYIEVLDRQSTRLKKLIEDLVEASKASTGSLSVKLVPCDVGVLLTQAVGEYDERLSAGILTPVVKTPGAPVMILADGRHLWRIFDNLMNNICKYAQDSTRVYFDLAVVNNKAVITFRNISKYPLNISSEELMERFVRGDASRSTEGSGLGLSIARSLTELQGGHMDITIDGDLFKVVLTFDITAGTGRGAGDE